MTMIREFFYKPGNTGKEGSTHHQSKSHSPGIVLIVLQDPDKRSSYIRIPAYS